VPPCTASPARAQPRQAAAPSHPIMTHARAGVFKPNPKYALTSTSPVSTVPRSVHVALRDPWWREAMLQEFNALQQNNTWSLVPRTPGARVLSGKWVWKIKTGSDGAFKRCKARWVVRGDR
jgi:histone deacetylase 1/2